VDDLMRLVKVVQFVHAQLATDPAFFASGFLDQELDQAARRSALEENVGELPETYSSRTVEYGAWTDEHGLTLVPVDQAQVAIYTTRYEIGDDDERP
jgi:hypothetical protein